MNREIKLKPIYQSPDTDVPNEVLVGTPLTIQEIFHINEYPDTQVDFADGGYLRFNEMEEAHTKWVQYTGLKDKNGKEIYEGDILSGNAEMRSRYTPKKTHPYYVVEFREGKFVTQCLNGNFEIYPDLCMRNMHLEVIGNIHENSELLN